MKMIKMEIRRASTSYGKDKANLKASQLREKEIKFNSTK